MDVGIVCMVGAPWARGRLRLLRLDQAGGFEVGTNGSLSLAVERIASVGAGEPVALLAAGLAVVGQGCSVLPRDLVRARGEVSGAGQEVVFAHQVYIVQSGLCGNSLFTRSTEITGIAT